MINQENIISVLRVFNIRPYTIWKHLKTNSLYMVIGTAICSTNDEREKKEESVVYISLEKQTMHYRKFEEFTDGRFEFVSPPHDDQKERL